jgi:GLPGLI family protein
MKLKLLFLFLFASLISNAQISGGYAIYKKQSEPLTDEMLKKIDSVPDISEKAKEMYKNMNKTLPQIIKKFEYKLVFNDNKGKYSKLDELSMDDFNIRLAKMQAGGNDDYFYDLDALYSMQDSNRFGERVLITTSTLEMNWVLSKESKVINGEVCFKATTTEMVSNSKEDYFREIIAWYNPSINIPLGPEGYMGLPGLIVEIENNGITTYLYELKNENIKEKIKFPTKGKQMNKSEYREYSKDMVMRFRGR